MKNRLHQNMCSLFASLVLVISSHVFANIESKGSTLPNLCLLNDTSTQQCINFVRGYLDALLQLNEVGLNPNFSQIEQRAFNNRVGKIFIAELIQKELNLCLPKEMSAQEILADIDKQLSLQDASLKVLKIKYPC